MMREFFISRKVPKCIMENNFLTNWNFSPQERLELSPRNKLELFSPEQIGTFSGVRNSLII